MVFLFFVWIFYYVSFVRNFSLKYDIDYSKTDSDACSLQLKNNMYVVLYKQLGSIIIINCVHLWFSHLKLLSIKLAFY